MGHLILCHLHQHAVQHHLEGGPQPRPPSRDGRAPWLLRQLDVVADLLDDAAMALVFRVQGLGVAGHSPQQPVHHVVLLLVVAVAAAAARTAEVLRHRPQLGFRVAQLCYLTVMVGVVLVIASDYCD